MQRWHDKRQKMESSAVAGKESSAVADKGRTPGLQIIGCTFLVERQEEDEDVPSRATTLQLGSNAPRGYVCPGYPLCECMDCDCEGPETEIADKEEAPRQYEILNANLGKGKGTGRSGGRAPQKQDRKANYKESGRGKGKGKGKT